jgi:hypothetical protein
MSDARKDTLLRWLPAFIALVGFIGNAVYVGRWIGAVEQRVEFLEKRPTQSENLATFVSRNEFNIQRDNRDRQIGDMGKLLTRIEEKLDRVIERQSDARLSKND